MTNDQDEHAVGRDVDTTARSVTNIMFGDQPTGEAPRVPPPTGERPATRLPDDIKEIATFTHAGGRYDVKFESQDDRAILAAHRRHGGARAYLKSQTVWTDDAEIARRGNAILTSLELKAQSESRRGKHRGRINVSRADIQRTQESIDRYEAKRLDEDVPPRPGEGYGGEGEPPTNLPPPTFKDVPDGVFKDEVDLPIPAMIDWNTLVDRSMERAARASDAMRALVDARDELNSAIAEKRTTTSVLHRVFTAYGTAFDMLSEFGQAELDHAKVAVAARDDVGVSDSNAVEKLEHRVARAGQLIRLHMGLRDQGLTDWSDLLLGIIDDEIEAIERIGAALSDEDMSDYRRQLR